MNKLYLVSVASLFSLFINPVQAMDEPEARPAYKNSHLKKYANNININYKEGPLSKYFEKGTLNILSKGAFHIVNSRNSRLKTNTMKDLQLLSQRLFEEECKKDYPHFQGQLFEIENPYDTIPIEQCEEKLGDILCRYHSSFLTEILRCSYKDPLQKTALVINSTKVPLAVDVKQGSDAEGDYYIFKTLAPGQSILIPSNDPISIAPLQTLEVTALEADPNALEAITLKADPTVGIKVYSWLTKTKATNAR